MADSETLSLSAAYVVGSTGVIAPGVVVVRDGLIADVGPLTSGTPEFDVLAPGFVDLQVNGIGSHDVATADGSDWDALGEAVLSQGVTTWCPTLVTGPERDIQSALQRIGAAIDVTRNSPNRLPEIVGAHLEGPFITVEGAHRREYIVRTIEEDWAPRLGPLVKIVTLAPEVPGATDAIEELARKGVLVSLGHSACSAEQAHAGAAAGARLVTHLGNASGQFHQRHPGLLGAALSDRRLSVSLIADLEHVHADLIRMAFLAKGPGGVVLVTDAVATSAGTVGRVELDIHGPPGSAARLADGTLAGSALTMDRAVANVVMKAGIDLADAIRAASTTPATLLGLSDRGQIATGMRADLVALRRAESPDAASDYPGSGYLDYASPLVVEAVWMGGNRSLLP